MTDLCKCDIKEKLKAMWERLQTTIYGIRLNGQRLIPDGQGVIDIVTDDLIEIDDTVRNNSLPVQNKAIKSYVDGTATTLANSVSNLRTYVDTADRNLSGDIADLKDYVDGADAGLSNSIQQLRTHVNTQDAALGTRITNQKTYIDTQDTALGNRITGNSNRIDGLETMTGDAITSSDITTDASTVTIVHKHLNTTVDTDSMPVASGTQAGVINASDYQAFVQLQEDVNDLKGTTITYSITLGTSTPTQEQITQAFTSSYPSVSLIAGIKVADYTQNLAYQYDGSIWVSQQFSGSIPIASTTVLGGVKGSTTNGQVAVNVDGTMALNGYDSITNRLDDIDGTGGSVEQLESEVGSLQTAVTGHGNRLDTAEGNIQTLDSDITEIDGDIVNLTTSVNQNASDITTLQGTVAGHTTSIDANARNIGALQTTVTGHTSDISTINGQISSINTAVSGNQTAISSLQTTVAGKQDALTAGENITITNNVISATGGGGKQIYTYSLDNLIEFDTNHYTVLTEFDIVYYKEGFMSTTVHAGDYPYGYNGRVVIDRTTPAYAYMDMQTPNNIKVYVGNNINTQGYSFTESNYYYKYVILV